ncbi:receptor-like protein 12 [Vigna radiata var. radiata]|uniref:Receptor-like protein 12 n=1 Tax=Vigna radiata var. radiata TaxID=3916 RepID=A0A3Q0EWS5_VIGRR|nr:receptor-like protein 12 [Vigna radiata var. radiata]
MTISCLDHFFPEPVGTKSNLVDNQILFPKSMMEFWGSPRQDLIVERLSEFEKVAYAQHHIRCLPKEREALLQFKAAIVDDYGMLSSWTTPDCCQWEGIRCNNLTAHIISLHLPGQYHYESLSLYYYDESISRRYISGEIHKSLMELRHLQYFNLSFNYFRESNIPEFLGSLTNLRYLDLSSCGFSGQIPTQISSLSHLKYLNLAHNYYLNGSIPREIGNLSRLEYLDLSGNSFEGSLPSQIGNLSRLQYLDLRYNSFEGYIPSQLGNLSNLHKLYLGGYDSALKIFTTDQWLSNLNSLTHLSFDYTSNFNSSPSWLRIISMLPKLRELSLIGCGLSDHFLLSFNPSNFNFSTSFSVLRLSLNSFTQPMIFQWVSNTTSNLVELDLSWNLLKGLTSNHFGLAMNSLEHLDLSYNVLKGEDLKSFINICTLHSLYMNGNNMTEDLSSILHNFSRGCVRYSLQELSLAYNQIRGSILDLSAFSNLKVLDISNNQLSGKIPESTRLPSHLEQLSISSNSLEGGVPKSFGSTCTLELLDLSYNKLSEDLTVIFNHLSGCSRYSLRELYLGQNKVNGTLPDFSIFAKLETLDLSINQISGNLPKTLELLRSLKQLYLDSNKLNGTISEDLRFPRKLEILSLRSNSLKGVLTDAHFFNMTKLRTLMLSDNSLTLEVSQNWASAFQLDNIELRSCKLGPLFPKWLEKQNEFRYLDISNSGISGTVPKWFWTKFGLSILMSINISCNNLQGTIPNLPIEIHYSSLSLASNKFEGHVPPFLRGSTFLDLSNNKFTNSFSFLCSSGVAESLYQLDLSNNKFFGQIPDCWIHFKSLTYLNMSHNKFSGEIPSSMGSLLQLQVLLLRRNNLIGEIPSSLRRCTNLVMVDISENRLSGYIPNWIGKELSKLQFLSLGRNYLYGSLPLKICYLKSIQLLDLSLNNLSGQIPKCIKHFSSMTRMTSLTNYEGHHYSVHTGAIDRYFSYKLNAILMWKGSKEMFTDTGLSLLNSIDLSNNQISGEIPKEIEGLFGLVSLNLSRNQLKGKIPSNVGKLTSLEFLDLSQNQLVGSIPSSLAQIDRLTMLDLSHNYLSGKIPTGTQLQSFDASKYEDNVDLCGPPLKELCIDGMARQGPIIKFQEDDNLIFNREYYISMTIGFVISFWGVFGSIIIIRSWRHAYFEFLTYLSDSLYVMTMVKVLKRLHTT